MNTAGGFYCQSSGNITYNNYFLLNNKNITGISNIICTSPCNSSICFCPPNTWGPNCLPCDCQYGQCNNYVGAIKPCTCSNSSILGENCNLICPICYTGSCLLSSDSETVQCSCPQGYDPSVNCTNCLPTFYGIDCSKQCNNCYNHGTCFFGTNGNGMCICNSNYDASDNCATAIGGQPTWIIPLAASIGGVAGLIIIVGAILCFMQVTTNRRVKAMHEELVIGENVHVSNEFNSTNSKNSPSSIVHAKDGNNL